MGERDEAGPDRSRSVRRGRFERFLFSFMGPPQLGDLTAPVRQPAATTGPPCSKCGQPYDDHEIVRDPRLTYTRCPGPRTSA